MTVFAAKPWRTRLGSLVLSLPLLVACRGERAASKAQRTPSVLSDAGGADSQRSTPSVSTAASVRRSELPLNLVGTVVREDPAKSMAAIRVSGALVATNFRPGQTVIDDVTLVTVERNRVVLRRGATLEFVPLSPSSRPVTPAANEPTPETIPTPEAVVTLQRTDVDRALQALGDDKRGLKPGTLEIDGRRLLIVGDVEPGGLYDLLELEERDVLMQVNGNWVNDKQNSLWTALREAPRVTLLVMRAGAPRTFEYVIE